MARPVQLEFSWRDLGQRYIGQLESDLKLERERSMELREDVKFYRGKCERLELAIAQTSNVPAQQVYAARTESTERPPLQHVEVPRKKSFRELRAEWNKLPQAEQEKIVETGTWNLDEEVKDAGSNNG